MDCCAVKRLSLWQNRSEGEKIDEYAVGNAPGDRHWRFKLQSSLHAEIGAKDIGSSVDIGMLDEACCSTWKPSACPQPPDRMQELE